MATTIRSTIRSTLRPVKMVHKGTRLNQTPDKFSGLIAWWDANYGVSSNTYNGDTVVSAVADRSGNSKNATNSTDSTKPLLIDSTEFTGRKTLKFGTTRKFLDFGDTELTDFTIHIFCKTNLKTTNDITSIMSGNAAGTMKGAVYTQGILFTGYGYTNSVASVRAAGNFPVEWALLTFQKGKLYKNGIEVAAYQLQTPSVITLSSLGRRTDAVANFFDGEILEVCMYNAEHEQTDITSVYEYFSNKYKYEYPVITNTVLDYTISDVNGNYWCGVDHVAGKLVFSDDNGQSFSAYTFTNYSQVNFFHIFDNGNIVFFTYQKAYKTTVSTFGTFDEIPILDLAGNAFVFENTNNHFSRISRPNKSIVGTTEVLCFGNYVNVAGAAPVIFWRVNEDCINVRVAYIFGLDPDDGYGDASNPLFARHIHSSVYDSVNDYFYFITGDGTTSTAENEIHWMRGRYDVALDSWSWTELLNANGTNRYKGVGLKVSGENFVWASDCNGADGQNGAFKSPISGIADLANHIKIGYSKARINTTIPIVDFLDGFIYDDYYFAAQIDNNNNRYIMSCHLTNNESRWHLINVTPTTYGMGNFIEIGNGVFLCNTINVYTSNLMLNKTVKLTINIARKKT